MAKKLFWILGPSPFKSNRTINAIIYANVIRAQKHLDRPLSRPEIAQLIKKMKEKKLFTSKQDYWALYNNFITTMRAYKLIASEKPSQEDATE